MCHKAWCEKVNYLCIDMKKKIKMKVKIVFSMKVKIHFMNAFPKLKLFKVHQININKHFKY